MERSGRTDEGKAGGADLGAGEDGVRDYTLLPIPDAIVERRGEDGVDDTCVRLRTQPSGSLAKRLTELANRGKRCARAQGSAFSEGEPQKVRAVTESRCQLAKRHCSRSIQSAGSCPRR